MIKTMLSCNLECGMELPFKFDGSAICFFFFYFWMAAPPKWRLGHDNRIAVKEVMLHHNCSANSLEHPLGTYRNTNCIRGSK